MTQCPICNSATQPAGTKRGETNRREFHLCHCPSCRFSFIEDPWTEYDKIYDEMYFRGKGADLYVDYEGEQKYPERTVRAYEWRGLFDIVSKIAPSGKWLDYGCGTGGLVRYASAHGREVFGYEPSLPGTLSDEELDASPAQFSVVTMIEVIEHLVDPMPTLRRVRKLLQPGGVLFLTTGNAKPFRGKLTKWRYVVPEIHVSFFEPETLSFALREARFEPRSSAGLSAWRDVIRFKALKSLRMRYHCRAESLLPWALLSGLLDWRLQLSKQPYGVASGE